MEQNKVDYVAFHLFSYFNSAKKICFLNLHKSVFLGEERRVNWNLQLEISIFQLTLKICTFLNLVFYAIWTHRIFKWQLIQTHLKKTMQPKQIEILPK